MDLIDILTIQKHDTSLFRALKMSLGDVLYFLLY